MATILEHSKIQPMAESMPADDFSLPLVFFDLVCYGYPAAQSLLFFEFPCTKSHFLDTIVPDLKSSLSLTLNNFLPLAGNIIHPLNPGDKPILRYESGDSVSFTVSESNADFNRLTGNHPRVCDEFYTLAPCLPLVTRSRKCISCPVLALQVTLFPERGLCVGYVFNHAVGDANTIVSFVQAWARANRNLPHRAENVCSPYFNRETLVNRNGLFSIFWDIIVKTSTIPEPKPAKLPIGRVRTTFVLKKDEIQKLKDLVYSKCPGVAHLSSLTIVCALVLVCSAKSATEEVADDEPEYLNFAADCRGRLDPPLPANYFGNCLGCVTTKLKHGEVKGSDGFVIAVKSIGEAIKETVYNDKGILYGAEKWLDEYYKMIGKQWLAVFGSPRFDLYAVDFGWGKPNKVEELSIDDGIGISLCKSRDFDGGFEIGWSKTADQMDAFTKVFNEVLSNLLE